MEIRCIDHDGSRPSTFIVEIADNVILFNCPLDIAALSLLQGIQQHPKRTTDQDEAEEEFDHLGSILAKYGPHDIGKLTAPAASAYGDAGYAFRTANFSLVDVNSIDVVIIANSEMMLGLPYLTEYLGYKGRILATEPTIEFARSVFISHMKVRGDYSFL